MTVIFSQPEIDQLRKIAAWLSAIEPSLDTQISLIVADGMRQSARSLVSIADAIDPRGGSLMLVDPGVGAHNLALNGMLKTIQQLQAKVAELQGAAAARVSLPPAGLVEGDGT